MPREELPDLGDVQRDVMHIVWDHGPITAEEVRKKLARALKEVTVRTVLRRLEEKGYVTHTVEGRSFRYKAIEERQHVAANAVQQVVNWFCKGSFEEVLLGMVDASLIDRRELQRLANKIAKAKSGRK